MIVTIVIDGGESEHWNDIRTDLLHSTYDVLNQNKIKVNQIWVTLYANKNPSSNS